MSGIFSIPDVLLWPFLASLVLAGIHVYFGIHVIARNVIFVDLALAQIAALGAIVGVFFGYETGHDNMAIYLYSLTFTFIGAIIFTITRSKGQKIPQEAIIGITYTVAFAATLIILSKSALGPHELTKILKGDILWVQKGKVIATAAIYALVGLFHLVFWKRFYELSSSYESTTEITTGHLIWDFLFYMSFGFVVASSVSLVGVFLVFSLLVIPSVTSMLLFHDIKRRLIFGWIFATAVCFLGMKFSWQYALPSSPLIVILFAAGLVITAFIKTLIKSGNKSQYLAKASAFIVVIIISCGLMYYFRKAGKSEYDELAHLLKDGTVQEKVYALRVLGNNEEYIKKAADMIKQLHKTDDRQIQLAICDLFKKTFIPEWNALVAESLKRSREDILSCYLELVRKKKLEENNTIIFDRLKDTRDFDVKLEIFNALLDLHHEESVGYMLESARDEPEILQEDLLDILNGHYHQSFGSLEEFEQWYKEK